jgi:predicted RNA binding protein YcfA (HicA-like mRNA interferase family)
MKVKEIIKLIEADGWYELPQKATSHRHWKHHKKTGRVTIAGFRPRNGKKHLKAGRIKLVPFLLIVFYICKHG